jgi:uridine monophosphate synthetase
MSFFSRLDERARTTNSLLCVGLDPHPADLPASTAAAARDFCLRLIDATAELALAFKPNAAFFEAFGSQGWQALQDVIAAIPKEIPVVLDAKRGDISSSAEAYARATFQILGAQAVTLNPYLGRDSLEPFLVDPERGVFLLCKTSNPGSGDLQDLLIISDKNGKRSTLTLYQQVACLAVVWNTRGNLGLVVGATHPQALAEVRRLAPDLWILAPGVGAQGGDLTAALQAGLRHDGLGLLLPVSRAISKAVDPFRAASDLRDTINRFRTEQSSHPVFPGSWPAVNDSLKAGLARDLIETGCVKFGQFTLKSGLVSPIYVDLRQLVSYPAVLARVAAAYRSILDSLTLDRLAALPYAALPIGTAVSLQSGIPLVYPRKETKEYGTRAVIEGLYLSGEQVAVIDDLATTGESKFEAIHKLESAGLKVKDVVVLIDRQSGAKQTLEAAGFLLHSVFTLPELLEYWDANRMISSDQIGDVRKFLSQHG